MILKPTIIIISCFLFMSTVSPRLALCFRVPQLLLEGGSGGHRAGAEHMVLSVESHPSGQTWGSCGLGGHRGPVCAEEVGEDTTVARWA